MLCHEESNDLMRHQRASLVTRLIKQGQDRSDDHTIDAQVALAIAWEDAMDTHCYRDPTTDEVIKDKEYHDYDENDDGTTWLEAGEFSDRMHGMRMVMHPYAKAYLVNGGYPEA